jgi:hypothetical protein
VKSTGVGGEERGYDGGKKIKGRKRHLLVDTEGFLLKAKVHAADIMERDGIKLLLEGVRERFSASFSSVAGRRLQRPGQRRTG